MHSTASQIIKTLELTKHPEGGYYKETYRSLCKTVDNLQQSKSAVTAIYFLLCNEEYSAWHKIKNDEMWYYNTGDSPVDIYILMPNGTLQTLTIEDVSKNPRGKAQALVPGNHWFSAKLKNQQAFALMSCVVCPGFDYVDFELMSQKDLTALGKNYTQHKPLLETLAPRAIRASL